MNDEPPERVWLSPISQERRVSAALLRRALALLDATFDALAAPERWCKNAFAEDAEGDSIDDVPIVEAVESPDVVSRCNFAELLHQGLARGNRIEIATLDDRPDQIPREVTRAPASWLLAAIALAIASLSASEKKEAELSDRRRKSKQPQEPMRIGQFVLASIRINDRGSYEDAIRSVALAAEILQTELDLRAAAERRANPPRARKRSGSAQAATNKRRIETKPDPPERAQP